MSERAVQFYGKYRGVVTNNIDPQEGGRGRLKLKVPDVLGDLESGWAMPCVPYAGNNVGLFLLPPVGASVWVEFEHGDSDFPIWTGCFWGEGETLPASPAEPEKKVLKTDMGTITLDDSPGGGSITIETVAGMKITLDASGIEVTDGLGGSIKLAGPNVSINDGALEVT
jgi:uncharacterized protein involved in type VI secretion and phage assembly